LLEGGPDEENCVILYDVVFWAFTRKIVHRPIDATLEERVIYAYLHKETKVQNISARNRNLLVAFISCFVSLIEQFYHVAGKAIILSPQYFFIRIGGTVEEPWHAHFVDSLDGGSGVHW